MAGKARIAARGLKIPSGTAGANPPGRVLMSAGEVVKLTKMGSYRMDAPATDDTEVRAQIAAAMKGRRIQNAATISAPRNSTPSRVPVRSRCLSGMVGSRQARSWHAGWRCGRPTA